MSAHDFVSGDTGSILRVTCKDSNGTVIDLTGASVALEWRDRTTETLVMKTMTINSPATAGIVQYQFGASELVYGEMDFEVKITDSGGKVIRSLDLLSEKVRAALA